MRAGRAGPDRRTRWGLVLLCVLLGAALALYPLTLVEAEAQVIAPAAGTVGLFAVAAVFGFWRCAGAAALLLIGEYAVALIVRNSGVDISAVGIAAALFVELELLDLARQKAQRASVHKDVVIARGRFVAGISAAGLAAGTAALMAGTIATGGHPLTLLAGAAAALGGVWLTVTLARRAVGCP